MGSPVGIVGGPCETVEIGTSHQSIMPEQRGHDAAEGGASWMIGPWTFPDPDDELAGQMRAELNLAPARHARYQREYLGWGVFVLMDR